MKRIFTSLIITFLFINGLFAKEQVVPTTMDSVRVMLAMALDRTQLLYDYQYFPLLAYLDHTYAPDSLHVRTEQYKKKQNQYYYKRVYMYSKLLDPKASVSFDCLQEEESGKWNKMYELLFYALYDGADWKFPADYAQQLEESATQDPFYGPIQGLINIYFLKQYGYARLSAAQKQDLKGLETKFAKYLYATYVQNKPWGYRRLYALWAIRINGNPVADDVKVSELTEYFDRKTFQVLFMKDYDDAELIKREGGNFMISINKLCALWLFCMNK